jgi:uncharacterized membrane protein YqhA
MIGIRYVAIIPVVFSLLGAVMMLLLGAWKTMKAVWVLYEPAAADEGMPEYLGADERMIISLVESMDAFLIGLVMLMFAAGIHNLFVGRIRILDSDAPWAWMKIDSIASLKHWMVEMIVVVMAVLFLRVALFEAEQLEWKLLVLPAGIALLAVSVKLIGWHEHDSGGDGGHGAS